MPSVLQRIRQAILNERFKVTPHAEKELEDDGLRHEDAYRVLMTGKLVQRQTHDPRGTRYVIEGYTIDGRKLQVVCRFHEVDHLRIITVYLPDER